MFEAIGEIFRTATPWISAGINLLSTVKAFQSADDIEEYGAFNRRVFEDEAAAVWRSYEDQSAILSHQQALFRATARTAYSKSGVTLAGTPTEVLADMVYQQERDLVALRHEAEAERLSRLNKAVIAEWEAGQYASSTRSQALSSFATTLLDPDIRYPWRSEQATAEAATTSPNYTTAQANAVPGRRGWRPLV